MIVCPKCEAERALERVDALLDTPRTLAESPYAQATGLLQGALDSIVRYPHQLCSKHKVGAHG